MIADRGEVSMRSSTGRGHWVPEEKPERTAALLLEFLAG
jgi:pimeloyl-ACP methyl ester carboxylesterase